MILLRTLRKDYARYSKDDELDDMVISSVTINVIVNYSLKVLDSDIFI